MGIKSLMCCVALVVALAGLACSTEEDKSIPLQVRTLTGMSARFTPNVVTVRADVPIQITLKNPDLVDHDWVIQGLPAADISDDVRGGHGHTGGGDHGTVEQGAIAAHASPGQSARAWFMPVRPGRYEFYCSVPGHRESGMVGTLIVK